jgi:hypothetical protein
MLHLSLLSSYPNGGREEEMTKVFQMKMNEWERTALEVVAEYHGLTRAATLKTLLRREARERGLLQKINTPEKSGKAPKKVLTE